MGSWLAKTEPSSYSWQRLVKEKRARWDGVRNAQARNNLASMNVGDKVLIYHSGDDKAVVGIAKVAKTAYPDPTADDPRWLCVDLIPDSPLPSPVLLKTIKAQPGLSNSTIVRNSRLSVMPLTVAEFRAIVALAKA